MDFAHKMFDCQPVGHIEIRRIRAQETDIIFSTQAIKLIYFYILGNLYGYNQKQTNGGTRMVSVILFVVIMGGLFFL